MGTIDSEINAMSGLVLVQDKPVWEAPLLTCCRWPGVLQILAPGLAYACGGIMLLT